MGNFVPPDDAHAPSAWKKKAGLSTLAYLLLFFTYLAVTAALWFFFGGYAATAFTVIVLGFLFFYLSHRANVWW